jgi:hypothetical protein
MNKVIAFLGGSLLGGIGWWAGAPIGMMTAFMLSTVGTGVGMYYAKKWADEHLP